MVPRRRQRPLRRPRASTSEFVHGGPNTPAVAQVLAAGDADVGVASDELQLIQANAEGADFVILGAMYQRSPNGMVLARRDRRSRPSRTSSASASA